MASTLSKLFARLENLDKKTKEVVFLILLLSTVALIYMGHTKTRVMIYPGYFLIMPTLVMAIVYFRIQPCCKRLSPNVDNDNATVAPTTHQFRAGTDNTSTATARIQLVNTISQQNQSSTTDYAVNSPGTHNAQPYPPVAGQQGANMCSPYPPAANEQGTNVYPSYPPVAGQQDVNMCSPYPPVAAQQGVNMYSPYPPEAGQGNANTSPGYQAGVGQQDTKSSPAYPSAPYLPGQLYQPSPSAYNNLSYSVESDLPPPPSYDDIVKTSK